VAFEFINPQGLEKPVGYSHIAKISSGSLVYIAGQAPFDAEGRVVGKRDFVAQFRQVIKNLGIAITAAGARPEQVAVLTMYVTDAAAFRANLKPIGEIYQAVFGKHFPAITLVEAKGLYNPDCMIEVSGVLVIG
jgi:enamine deaminase RidA (YjgF/YER057c/UK114 family)